MSAQNGSAGGSKETTPVSNGTNGTSNGGSLTYEEELCLKLEDEARLQKFSTIPSCFALQHWTSLVPGTCGTGVACRLATEARACTGVLGIHPLARDIKIDNFSVTFYGTELLQDTKLELSVGNRWATLLTSI